MRQIVLDTETTGLEFTAGHRIIEIGCVEIVNRRVTDRYFHQYLQPDFKIDSDAFKVHGITNEFLQDKPRFTDIVQKFIAFIQDAELIIHNAKFDVGFLNHELSLLSGNWQTVEQYCQIVDTLELARRQHPGQKNNLDALCKRYQIDNTKRELHGALLDANLLAEVYLAMTGGQISLLSVENNAQGGDYSTIKRVSASRPALPVIHPSAEEIQEHNQLLAAIDKQSGGRCVWLEHD
jgi:DNA polymerase-3 subunit epsilon